MARKQNQITRLYFQSEPHEQQAGPKKKVYKTVVFRSRRMLALLPILQSTTNLYTHNAAVILDETISAGFFMSTSPASAKPLKTIARQQTREINTRTAKKCIPSSRDQGIPVGHRPPKMSRSRPSRRVDEPHQYGRRRLPTHVLWTSHIGCFFHATKPKRPPPHRLFQKEEN